ncbi:hypothetical protein [Leadbetterella sp. DM7]|uniref:hypothetical protein n=1 Tax=Leadbetterella sp. DM7 TaxID=3235085 RepID=UPI00349EC69F
MRWLEVVVVWGGMRTGLRVGEYGVMGMFTHPIGVKLTREAYISCRENRLVASGVHAAFVFLTAKDLSPGGRVF